MGSLPPHQTYCPYLYLSTSSQFAHSILFQRRSIPKWMSSLCSSLGRRRLLLSTLCISQSWSDYLSVETGCFSDNKAEGWFLIEHSLSVLPARNSCMSSHRRRRFVYESDRVGPRRGPLFFQYAFVLLVVWSSRWLGGAIDWVSPIFCSSRNLEESIYNFHKWHRLDWALAQF